MHDAAAELEAVQVTASDGGFLAQAPPLIGSTLFGGLVLGQAVHAATREAPEGKRLHSLHAYFLRPTRAEVPVRHEVCTVREGRSFATREVRVSQEDRPVVQLTCSFTAGGQGYEYGLALAADVPGPDDLPHYPGPGPLWEIAMLGATEPRDDGFRESSARHWVRTTQPVPDDEGLHVALLTYLTDMTWTGSRPLRPEGDVRGIVSLDHALWLHRAPRLDDWHFYDVQCLGSTDGRSLVRGSVYDRAGTLVASSAQEMVVAPYESVTTG